MSQLALASRFLKYWWKGVTPHGVHSPFVFDFFTGQLKNPVRYYAFDAIEKVRQDLTQSDAEINVEDHGAGSRVLEDSKRRVKDIVRLSSQQRKYGEVLFKLCNMLQPTSALELGTCLGIGTAYMAMACKGLKVTTIEGDPNLAALARKNLDELKLDTVEIINGKFDDVLPTLLADNPTYDIVYIDGNHRYEPTMKYLNLVLPHLSDTACVVLDDIHWSTEMEQAWNEIKTMKEFQVSIDLFKIGLLFKRPAQSKEDFILRY